MATFDASKGWTILLPSDIPHVKKAAADLSRYIGLLSTGSAAINSVGKNAVGKNADGISPSKAPPIVDAIGSAPEGAVIVLSSGDHGYERNGFTWRAREDRVEISGESGRGLCNGIYSFLAALGISWPAPGQEELPKAIEKDTAGLFVLALASDSVCELSHSGGDTPMPVSWSSAGQSSSAGPPSSAKPALANLRRFFPGGKGEVKKLLKESEAFVEWAARRRYDALVFPLAAYASASAGRKLKQLRQIAGEYGIAMEAGGRELSSLVPRRYFPFCRDFFRMDDGKRKKDHHFCPTNPDVTRLIAKESERLFRFAPEAAVIHLWPDKEAELAWCSCPTCRAFSSLEQNRIAINVAADTLAALNRGKDRQAFIFYFEKPGEDAKILPRKNTFAMSEIP